MFWRRLSISWLVALLFAVAPGCVIGTWPTPEVTKPDLSADERGKQIIGQEVCDGLDDDADGSIDEGCECKERARGCIGIDGAQCGWGVQWCASGYWAECADIGPPFAPKRPPSLTVVKVEPEAVVRDETVEITVVVAAAAACYGIQIPSLEVALVAHEPVMRIRALARDDGLGNDEQANDDQFTATVRNVFGPGVPAQTLAVTASAEINENTVMGQDEIELEAP